MNLFDVVSKIGFPITVALWLLVRMEKKMDENTKSVDKLTDKIVGKDGILDKIEGIEENLGKKGK